MSTEPKFSERSRLPIQHPDYRYAPTKNIYGEKIKEFSDLIHSDNDTETRRGEWRASFRDAAASLKKANRRKLHVEVGCNGGHVILEWAAKNPDEGWIGLDWKFKQIYRGGEKAHNRGIKNLMFLRANLARLKYMFSPGEIDCLYLYFPDPWAKKSQWKNRSITAESLRELRTLVAADGVFHIKTDHAGYFEWMKEAFAQVGDVWKIERITDDLHAGNSHAQQLKIPEVTLFEKLFIKDGIPIHSAWLKAI
jgi:tRNA (guanine-N7-)-methyltransferase